MKNDNFQTQFFHVLLLLAIAIYSILHILIFIGIPKGLAFLIIILLFISIYIYMPNPTDTKKILDKKRNDQYKIITDMIKELSLIHHRALKTKQQQLTTTDPYGNINDEKFYKEVVYFYKNVFTPEIVKRKIDLEITPIEPERFYFELLNILENIDDSNKFSSIETTDDQSAKEITPVEFELICIQKLNNIGWKSRGTKGSGDQGIDIIAEKNDLKAVFQCKHYSTPVGNKAVQEILAGKQFELADIAAVVTNSRYTKSAVELAQSCNVILLHHSDLDHFDSIASEYC